MTWSFSLVAFNIFSSFRILSVFILIYHRKFCFSNLYLVCYMPTALKVSSFPPDFGKFSVIIALKTFSMPSHGVLLLWPQFINFICSFMVFHRFVWFSYFLDLISWFLLSSSIIFSLFFLFYGKVASAFSSLWVLLLSWDYRFYYMKWLMFQIECVSQCIVYWEATSAQR